MDQNQLDRIVEGLHYDLTHKADKTNPKSRISLSTDLLHIIKAIYYQRNPKLMKLTNLDIASFAMINLLPLEIQNKLLAKIKTENRNLYELMLTVHNHDSQNQSQINNEKLNQIQVRQAQISKLLFSLLNADSYLLAKANHLDNASVKVKEDLYPALRNDDLKAITDLLIFAGDDEEKRQKHLTNL